MTGQPSHPFRYYMRVRFQECDAQHVVFNARYGDYIDIADHRAQVDPIPLRVRLLCVRRGQA